jgi:hypothetical protein
MDIGTRTSIMECRMIPKVQSRRLILLEGLI